MALDAENARYDAEQKEQQCQVGSAWIEKDLVFTNAQGYFYSASTLRKVFRRFLVSIGLPHMRFHDLRHSEAIILLAMNVRPKVVQEILGHSQITMTLDVYSHALPSMQEEVTKHWDSEFGKLPVKKWLFLPPCFNGLVRAQLRNVGRTIRP